jgi:hypothetical protein
MLTGVSSFTFDGLDGNDSMTVTSASGKPQVSGGVFFDGGTGTNTLTVDAGGDVVRTVPGGAITAADPLTTRYANVQAINLNNAAAVNVSAGPDTADRSTAFKGLTAQERFVQALYLDALGRAGTQSELDGWVAFLNSPGGSQARVARGIEGSLEAQDRLVKSWYFAFLGRPAQGGEELGWVNRLQAGQSEEQVLSLILGDSGHEFYDRAQALGFAGTADQNYVRALYQALLGRTAGKSEVDSWVNALATQGRQGVALGFLSSQELRSYQFEGHYNALLHRPSDAAGLSGWVLSGLDLRSVRLAFERGDEFFTNG